MNKINWKHTLFAGIGIGAILGCFISILFVKIGIDPGSLAGLLGIFVFMAFISAFLINKSFESIGIPPQNLKHLILISLLTSIIPLFGASFGAPNSDLSTLGIIILIGSVGGLFWSIPFSTLNYYRNRNED